MAVGLALSVPGQRDRLLDVAPLTSSGVAVLAIVLAGVLLIARREYPVPVWVATVGLAVVASLDVGGNPQAVLPCLVAVYTVATRAPVRTVTVVTALTVLGPWSSVVALRSDDAVDALFALIGWAGAATAVGVAVRSQRIVIGAARQRAWDAERTADEQAQRRVAEERLRIARELHDIVAHHAAVITVQAGVARHLLPTDPAAAAQALDHVRDAGQLILREIPTLLGVLRTDEDDAPTAPTPRLAEAATLIEAARHAGLAVRTRQSGVPVALDPVTDLTAYRVVQEALTNAVKHGSGEAEVSVRYEGDTVVVEIRNPLPGPGAAPPGIPSGGNGLIGMRERMAAVGGDLQVGLVGDVWVVRAVFGTVAPVTPERVARA